MNTLVLAHSVRGRQRSHLVRLARKQRIHALDVHLGLGAKAVSTVKRALARAAAGHAALLRVGGPTSLAKLHPSRGRVIALSPVLLPFRAAQWRAAVALASNSDALDLVVWPRGKHSLRAMIRYLGVLKATLAKSEKSVGADPAPPTGLTQTASTSDSVTIAWQPSGTGVVGYRVQFATTAANTPSTDFVITGLSCGENIAVHVQAFDAVGNISSPATIDPSTLACSGTGSGGGGSGGGSGGGPSPAVFVSPTGSDSTCARGDSSKPCATFNKAYELAQQGDLVQVAGGDYPGQTIAYDPSKTGAAGHCRLSYNGDGTFTSSTAGCVTFEPAPGAPVTLGAHTTTTSALNLSTDSTVPVASTAGFNLAGGIMVGNTPVMCSGETPTSLTGCSVRGFQCPNGTQWACTFYSGADVIQGSLSVIGASYVDLRGITANAELGAMGDGTHAVSDVIFDGDSSSYGFMTGSYVALENGTVGPNNGSNPFKIANCDHCVVYKTVDRGDTKTACNDPNDYCHADGFYVYDNTNLYFVADTLYGSDAFLIFFGHGSFSNPGPVTLANNYFGGCGPKGCYAVSIRGDTNDTFTGYTIEGNSSIHSWLIGPNSSGTNVSLVNWQVNGNVGIGIPCSRPSGAATYDVTYTYNVVSGGYANTPCSSASSPVASNNTGGVTLGSLFASASVGGMDLIGGPYAWENTWASCPLAVDHRGTSRPTSCTPGGWQR